MDSWLYLLIILANFVGYRNWIELDFSNLDHHENTRFVVCLSPTLTRYNRDPKSKSFMCFNGVPNDFGFRFKGNSNKQSYHHLYCRYRNCNDITNFLNGTSTGCLQFG